jgi:hypothetical protein
MILLQIFKSLFFRVNTSYLFLYLFLLFLTSQSVYLTISVNILVFSYVLLFWFRYKPNKFKRYLFFSSVGNLTFFELMVASYAELLVWEHVLHILLYVITYYYYFHSIYTSNETLRYRPFFDFKAVGYMKRNNL